MSIYITGDMHGEYGRLVYANKELDDGDILIACGDWGYIFANDKSENSLLDDIEKKNYSILFVDGNHENFPAIYSYPEEEWNGGRIHRIRNSIIHLCRGQVFEIEGLKFFTFGGGYSLDKWRRTENVDWWSQEMPENREFEEGKKNLEKHGFKVDYIITHTANIKTLEYLPFALKDTAIKPSVPEEHVLNYYLEDIRERCEYKKWFFGHFHKDAEIAHTKQRLLWYDMEKIN